MLTHEIAGRLMLVPVMRFLWIENRLDKRELGAIFAVEI
jgi:hypothetical protein